MRLFLAVTCFPLVLSLTAGDYARLDAGEALVELLPAESKEVAVRASTRVDADPARLIRWTRRVEALNKGRYVAAIGRFSEPLRIEDLEGLSLDGEDLMDLRSCRPGKCGVKLSDAEIAQVRETMAVAGSDWKTATQRIFRAIVLARAERYLAEGHTPSVSYHDARKPLLLDSEFAAVASAVELAHPRLFPLTNYLSLYPQGEMADVESFLYWSKRIARREADREHHARRDDRKPRRTHQGGDCREETGVRQPLYPGVAIVYGYQRLARRRASVPRLPEPITIGCVRRPVRWANSPYHRATAAGGSARGFEGTAGAPGKR